MESEEKLAIIQDAIDEMKALDVTVISVREQTHLMDFIVVCSGTSNIHIRSITDRIMEKMKAAGVKGIRSEGYNEARWVLVDYGDVVVNIFDPEERAYYRLEDLWQKARPEASEPEPASA